MSRRTTARDLVEMRATDAVAAAQLDAQISVLMSGLTEPQKELLRGMFRCDPVRRTAESIGMSYREAQDELCTAIRQALGPAQTAALDELGFDGEEFLRALKQSARGALREVPGPALRWCKYHGWTEPVGVPDCPECACELPLSGDAVRNRYCSAACRQRAHRKRQRDAG